MRYLVTGVAGFIASRVSERLLDAGNKVVGLDNLNDAYDTRLKQWRLERLQRHENFSFALVDIADLGSLRSTVGCSEEFDAVINLAARAGVRQSVEDPWVYYQTNTVGTLNLLEICKEHEIQKFVLASTSSLYGANHRLPYEEDDRTDSPLSPYAASKKAAETLCFTYHHLYGIDISIPRYFTVYGPAGRPDMSVFRFVKKIFENEPITVFGDGEQSRDFTFVDDIACGTVAALRPVGYRAFNLGSDSPVSVRRIIDTIESLIGIKARIDFKPAHPADVRRTWADNSRALSELDWEPKIGIDEGLAKSVEWYARNRTWARRIDTGEGATAAAGVAIHEPANAA